MAQRRADKVGASAPAKRGGQDLADGGGRDAGADERWRLRTLREYHILDPGPEPGFDRWTKLVADLFDGPIALVSLIDDRRQWFKSAHVLDVSETPREISCCQYAIAAEKPLIVPDAAADPRFRDNPLVTGAPHIRFYAGMPLRAHNGAILGTLCVIDRKPRAPLGQRELERLEDFAAIIMAEAELRRTAVERDEAQHALERALDFSSIATWQLDPRTDDLRWRGATAALWGGDYESALSTGEGFYARVHPDDRASVRRALEESFATGDRKSKRLNSS